MFYKYLNSQNIATLILAIALIIIAAPVKSTSNSNNGHGNNCDGIDASNPGENSPDGQNHNHYELNSDLDDEGKSEMPKNTIAIKRDCGDTPTNIWAD